MQTVNTTKTTISENSMINALFSSLLEMNAIDSKDAEAEFVRLKQLLQSYEKCCNEVVAKSTLAVTAGTIEDAVSVVGFEYLKAGFFAGFAAAHKLRNEIGEV